MPTTARLSLPYPADTDIADVPSDIGALANALDSAALDLQGPIGARPASGTTGRYYYATDTGVLSRDEGDEWVDVNPKDAAAAVPSMRTLGTGATQAAAGNDSRLTNERVPVNGTVTTAKIADAAVTTAKIADAQVTGSKIADGQVTGPKMASDLRGEWKIAGIWASDVGIVMAPDDGTVAHDLGYFIVNIPPAIPGLTRKWRVHFLGWGAAAASITIRDAFRPATVTSGTYNTPIGPFLRVINPVGDLYAATDNDATWTYFQWFNAGPGSPIIFQIMIRYAYV